MNYLVPFFVLFLNIFSQAQSPSPYKAIIPVVVHVIYHKEDLNIHDSLIQKEIDDLVADFSSENLDLNSVPEDFLIFVGTPKIKFELVDIKRIKTNKSNFTFKEAIFEANPPTDPTQHLNVYIGSIRFGKTLGYVNSTQPWKFSKRDGVALHYSSVGKKTRILTHEAGHWLGLRHIFDKDNINDTPLQKVTGSCNCPKHPKIQFGHPIMFMNFMDYSKCRKMFTRDQVTRMYYVLENYRSKFLVQNFKLSL